ncbi:uncharacterized protein [Amphiura filiformis]|uniref:uncharacterized protein n=1 Tax=Amphiura filiformis TaxID=82378 RepID=UPI003B224E8D
MCRISCFGVLVIIVVLCSLVGMVTSAIEVCNQRCRNVPTNRVCASDGFIYRNPCLMKKYACTRGTRLEEVPFNWCKLFVEADDGDDNDEEDDSESGEDDKREFNWCRPRPKQAIKADLGDDAPDENRDDSGEDDTEGKRRRPWCRDGIYPTLRPRTTLPQMTTLAITQSPARTTPRGTTTSKMLTTLLSTKRSKVTVKVNRTTPSSTSTEDSDEDSTTKPTPKITTTVPIPTTTATTTTLPTTTQAKTTTIRTTTKRTTTRRTVPTPKPTKRACPTMCPLVLEPVCGTDGITYTSVCVLLAEACFFE